MATNTQDDAFDKDDYLDTSEDDFIMAFALEDFYSGSLNDPRYVRWTARYITAHEDGTF